MYRYIKTLIHDIIQPWIKLFRQHISKYNKLKKNCESISQQLYGINPRLFEIIIEKNFLSILICDYTFKLSIYKLASLITKLCKINFQGVFFNDAFT